jgi:hypothetical protein
MDEIVLVDEAGCDQFAVVAAQVFSQTERLVAVGLVAAQADLVEVVHTLKQVVCMKS